MAKGEWQEGAACPAPSWPQEHVFRLSSGVRCTYFPATMLLLWPRTSGSTAIPSRSQKLS